jgi:hypothetical protein
LREELRIGMFENEVLRIMCGHKRDMEAEVWRKLPNELLNKPHCSPNILRVIKSRKMRWAGHVVLMGEGRGVYTILVGKPKGKSPL